MPANSGERESTLASQAYRKDELIAAIRRLERVADQLLAESVLLLGNPKRLQSVDPHQYSRNLEDRSDEIEEAVELLQAVLEALQGSGEQLVLPMEQAGPDKLP